MTRIEAPNKMRPWSISFVLYVLRALSYNVSVTGSCCSRISDQATDAFRCLGFKTADIVFKVRNHINQLIRMKGVGVCKIP